MTDTDMTDVGANPPVEVNPATSAEPVAAEAAEAAVGAATPEAEENPAQEQAQGKQEEQQQQQEQQQQEQQQEGQDKQAANDGADEVSVITLAGRVFTSSFDLMRAAYGDVPKDLEEDYFLSGLQAFIVFAILERHPRGTEKMGNGVQQIGFGLNKEFEEETKCFFVVHPDGSRTHFSLKKAAEEIFEKNYKELRNPVVKRKREEAIPSSTQANAEKKHRFAICTASDGVKLPLALLTLKEDLVGQGFPEPFLFLDGDNLRIEFKTSQDAKRAIEEVKVLKGVGVTLRPLTDAEGEAVLSKPKFAIKFPKGGKKGGGKKGGKGGKKRSS